MGGAKLINKYKGSLHKMIETVYPSYEWLPWKFAPQRAYWNDRKNQEQFIVWAGKQLGVKDTDQWNKFSNEVFRDFSFW